MRNRERYPICKGAFATIIVLLILTLILLGFTLSARLDYTNSSKENNAKGLEEFSSNLITEKNNRKSTRGSEPDLTPNREVDPMPGNERDENITFSNEKPNEGVTIIINSTIYNIGDADATTTVNFYDGDPNNNDLIGSDRIFIGAQSNATVFTLWNTSGEMEYHTVYVVVDPEDEVDESNEENNYAMKDIIVNQIPIADAGNDCIAFVGQEVIFDASNSTDTPSNILTLNYTWDFGDNTTGYEKIVSHIYAKKGTYIVTLKVKDDNWAVDIDIVNITVRYLPTVITITENLKLSRCGIGETIEVWGNVGFEFPIEYIDAEVPIVKVNIEIIETGANWSVRTNIEGYYYIEIVAPNSSGTFTIQATISYGHFYKSAEQKLEVVDGKKPFLTTLNIGIILTTATFLTGIGLIFGGTEAGRYKLLLLLFIPLYTRIKKENALDHFNRGRLYNNIETNPGVSFSELKRKFSFSNGNLAYHLRVLEKLGFINSIRDRTHRRFYPKDVKIILEEGTHLNEIQRGIINVIKQNPGITQSEIASIMGVSRQKISYNINALDYCGFIHAERKGSRKILYYPVESPESTGEDVKIYKIRCPTCGKYFYGQNREFPTERQCPNCGAILLGRFKR